MRSLRWGLELLSMMQTDQTVPEVMRSQATGLQPAYPTPEALNQLLALRAELLPMSLADSIEAAGKLFVQLRLSGLGAEGTRRHLMFTERHFPVQGDALSMATLGAYGGLAEWLEREEPARAD